ncbi:hypothetical protein KHP60_14525 [Microvirga sp. 3-52]|jgi:hypothetical protein|uniref:DUF6111 family protein n=1 Tax=Microvirga sp. 3-52 TaxID=2792425 RepID=UPI001ACCFEC1|nr:DUF6111 family protein [Microvirga sp. 3-52]MBO1906279.1 hypothetical protein [Microvirga sp. 3-52]MBS7453544.1 hypothetical protein [Microvirga sp. 3-52]
MTRAVVQGLVLFLLPFVLFGTYLIIRRRNPLLWSHWSDQSLWLTIVGLSFVVISLVVTGFVDERQTGTYVPTRVENGRVIPGHFE